jgi:cell division protein ZapA
MSDKIINTNVEILGKYYSIRCPEAELNSLQEAASYLNKKMQEVQDSGKAINLERIAIMAALNITNDLLQSGKQKTSLMDKINQQITHIQSKLETMIAKPEQTELIYTAE